MPSSLHEALLLLFRNRPQLAPELLRDALGVAVPAYTEARIESAELSELQPAEYRADLVILLYDGRPVLGIVIEVQLGPDDDKRFSWPLYVTGLRARIRCPLAPESKELLLMRRVCEGSPRATQRGASYAPPLGAAR